MHVLYGMVWIQVVCFGVLCCAVLWFGVMWCGVVQPGWVGCCVVCCVLKLFQLVNSKTVVKAPIGSALLELELFWN